MIRGVLTGKGVVMQLTGYGRNAHCVGGLVLVVVGAAFVTPVLAGAFGVYSNQGGDCTIADVQAGAISVYVYHRSPQFDLGVTGSAFRLSPGGGFTGVFESVSYDPRYLVVGDITQGVAVSYGSCLNDVNVLVAVATYQVFGTSAGCSYLEVLPFEDGGVVETYSCDLTMEPATGSEPLIVNYGTNCGPLWCVVGVQESTWGRIKALYR
jgi:hypothetical protein